MRIATLILLFIVIANLNAENFVISGKIIDKESQTPIPGATIRVIGTAKGSYSSSAGNFKQPVPQGFNKVKISSFGYYPRTIEVSSSDENMMIALTADTISLKGVEVVAEISAENIIKRAIEKKNENTSKLKTFKGLLYSKLTLELDGSVMSGGSDGKSISFSGSVGGGGGNREKFKMFVLETFSNQSIDYENDRTHSEIIQRRQTANIDPDENLLSLTDFRSFYENEIELMGTTIPAPLNDDAFDYYDYELVGRSKLDDRYIYDIKLIPNTSLAPRFEGNMKIVENTYNLYEINLKPSENTSIPFVNRINFIQKFQEVQKDLWHPVYLELTGGAQVDVLKGMVDMSVDFSATSMFSDMEANIELPDSLFKTSEYKITTVTPTADSVDLSYWQENSLRKIEPREIEMYNYIDSVVVADSSNYSESASESGGNLHFSYFPYIKYNKVNSLSLGIAPDLKIGKDIILEGLAAYSFGFIGTDDEMLGRLKLKYKPYKESSLLLFAEGYSDFMTMSPDHRYPDLLNSVVALFGTDYYDYYKADGISLGYEYKIQNFESKASVGYEKHFTQKNRTDFYLFKEDEFRRNPLIYNGEYTFMNMDMKFGDIPVFMTGNDFYYEVNVKLFAVTSNYTYEVYPLTDIRTTVSMPLFDLGYNPFRLDLSLGAGFSDKNMYREYQFKMPVSLGIFSTNDAFLSGQIADIGGTEYFEAHAKLNLTDIWWRFLRLPTYENRGLDLVLRASTGKYNYYRDSFYRKTGDDFYSEVGFGLRRIPTFLSNVVYLGVDAAWGIGNIAKGNFGWAISASLPF